MVLGPVAELVMGGAEQARALARREKWAELPHETEWQLSRLGEVEPEEAERLDEECRRLAHRR